MWQNEQSVAAQQTLLKCGNSLDVDEVIIDELLKFTCNVIYGDNKSSCMAEACADKWKAMKKEVFSSDTDCLHQHFICADNSTDLVLHLSLKKHPSLIGHGQELVDGYCHPIGHTHPAVPIYLPTLCL